MTARTALSGLLAVVATAVLSATPAAASGDVCTWHGLPCTGGGTGTGTVTGKGWNPPHAEYHSVGKGGHIDHLSQCWRLDVRWGPFRGWVCVDHDTWSRAKTGDRYVRGELR